VLTLLLLFQYMSGWSKVSPPPPFKKGFLGTLLMLPDLEGLLWVGLCRNRPALSGPKKDEINAETCELLLPYLWMPEFTFERAKAACGNVAGLCTWVRAAQAPAGLTLEKSHHWEIL
jgi:hypothetical protein